MKKIMKWLAIVIGAVVVLVVAALLIAPMFLDAQKFRPVIESSVEKATGRPLQLGGKLELSLFPWAGITLKDVSLGNPDGFETERFAEFSEFEVRMKLLPLISGDVQVKHIVLKGLRLVLEKNREGGVNWEFGAAGKGGAAANDEKEGAPAAGEALPVKALSVGRISVTEGSVLYIDRQSNVRKELSDVDIRMENISFDTPIEFSLSANFDGMPFSMAGNFGPIGKKPGEGNIELDLSAKALDVLEVRLRGGVTDPATTPAYRMHVAIAPFSPKRLMKAIAPELAASFADSNALEKLGLDVDISGDAVQVALSNGKLSVDDTTCSFQMSAKDFSKPDLTWQVHVDAVDIDRYLPKGGPDAAPGENAGEPEEAASASNDGGKAPAGTDYAPLRNLVLNGTIKVDALKAGGGSFQDIVLKVNGRGGKIDVDPLSMNLYQGRIQATSRMDLTGNKPKSTADVSLEGVEIEPLLKDFSGKDFITGTALARISLSMTGDAPEQIRQTLNGKGTLQFKDGKIRNVNLLGMVQNLQAAFGSGTSASSQETEFTEFQSTFEITDGVVGTSATTLSSPVLRVDVTGNANLVTERLDFRVNPAYINPKNQKVAGLTISGNQVPVRVTGTFSSPKFKPDLEAAAKKVVTEKLGEILGGSKKSDSEEGSSEASEQPATVEDSITDILKNLPFGK